MAMVMVMVMVIVMVTVMAMLVMVMMVMMVMAVTNLTMMFSLCFDQVASKMYCVVMNHLNFGERCWTWFCY